MTIDALLALTPPVAESATSDPSGAGRQLDWNDVHDELGIELPDDYRAFIEHFGFVRLDDFLMIYSPFAPRGPGNLIDQYSIDLDAYRAIRTGHEADMPLEPLPLAGGLLPLGRTDNGDQLFWRTAFEPNAWPTVVIADGDRHHQQFDLSITALLAGLIANDVTVAAFPEKFPRSSPTFIPVE
jgi:hypothetical protein